MAGTERSSSRTDLVRLGLGDLEAAEQAFDELVELLTLSRAEVITDLGLAADPDGALRCASRIARRNPDAVAATLRDPHARRVFWLLLGASDGFGEFYLRHPEELADLATAGEILPRADEMQRELQESVGAEDGFAASGDESAWVALRVRYRRLLARIAAFDLQAPDAIDVSPRWLRPSLMLGRSSGGLAECRSHPHLAGPTPGGSFPGSR